MPTTIFYNAVSIDIGCFYAKNFLTKEAYRELICVFQAKPKGLPV